MSAAVSETSHASTGTSGGNSTIFKETVTFWHLLKEIYHYLFVMESFLIFALQFILRQKSVKGNVTITILYLKVFHTHTHNLYFTDFTLKLFIVIFCYCPVSLCVSGCCYGRSTTPPFPGAHKFQSLGRLHFTDKKYFLRMLRRAQKH